MENWKQYLPWIIGAVVLLYVVSKMRQKTILAPQTQITQTPQVDPYLEARTNAFSSLVALAGIEAAQDTEKFKSAVGLTVANKSYDTQFNIANRMYDSEIAMAKIYADASNYAANLNLFQRNQDRQIQQGAIDRYYSSRNLDSITNSIALAVGSIFGKKGGGNIFGTPKTFPSLGFTF